MFADYFFIFDWLMIVPPQEWVFIADEAGISNDRFTVVGGLVMHSSTLESAYATLREYRNRHNMRAELKWQRVSNQKVQEYKALVDYFFAMNNSDRMHFHCIVFDSHQWNHRRYNNGDQDVGLSKLYYQLLLHKFVKIYGNRGELYIRVDHRNSSTSLEDVRRMLNATAARDHNIRTNPVKQFVLTCPPEVPSFITRVLGVDSGRFRVGQARRARSPQIAQAPGALLLDSDCPVRNAA